MSAAQNQCFLDVISRETQKLMSLKHLYSLEQAKLHNDRKVKDRAPFYVDNGDTEKEDRREQFDFQLEIERDTNEKRALLQAVISEAAASGHPLPPSFIKLMQSQNSKHESIST